MLIPEEFARCEKCNQGWFEKKEFVLVSRYSETNKKPEIYKKEIQFHCVGCGNIQYKYIEEE
ncbi:hypothetical protein QO179_24125 [Bacillus stercoris]|nr:hypothetical protein [Bacillus stercoris]